MAASFLVPAAAWGMAQSEQQRIDTIARISPSVVCILTPDQAAGGSGVIITPDGYGLTNFHVVAPLLRTRRGLGGLADGKTYPLEVLGIDPTGDMAMFRLTGRDRFEPATLGDSDRVRTGDDIIALGNPFMLAEDFQPTATFGIVSGLHRYQYGADARTLLYTDCIQIDASINPGNSGGPLFNLQGRLIGINGRASFKNQDVLKRRINVGVAYAISINQIRRFIPALRAGRLVEHGSLGATVSDSPHGVFFERVLPSSTAAAAGIRVGDELLEFDGRSIRSANAFGNALGVYPAGWSVSVRFRRQGSEYARQLNLDALPVRGEFPLPKADPAWVRESAATQPVLPAASAPASEPASDAPLARTIDAVLPGVMRIYGGRIGERRGYATGVLVSAEGEVVAALSLLLEAADVRVVSADGSVHTARVTYRDARRQLALLAIRDEGTATNDPSRHTALPLDPSVSPRAGDSLLVVGNPFKIAEGDEPCSVSRGILAGRVRLDGRQPGGEPHPYRGEVLLIDAVASNPGSPGSAVFDAQGRWVGLVGEMVESRLTHTLLNYAYPVSEVAAFLKDARSTDRSPSKSPTSSVAKGPGYHGIRLSRIGYRSRLPFVEAVTPGSPADRAGVQPGDLVLSVNGTSTPQTGAFDQACARLGPADEMMLELKRRERIVSATLTLGEAPR